MSDAREALRETALHIWAGDVDLTSDEVLDDICRIVADAMTSEATVRAGAIAITSDSNFGVNRWTDDARNVITAALAAAGITNGGAS